ncbi:DNA internalization-related competence protein ComEC/Rec2 [Enterococcus asini]|uniref:DNA internalization-related competence protein ComEC/Rec2 n=1 Tax=Enterococcus asini TaxID=57732 RepID=UPI00288CB1EF|nr:DNA internalization-related competence protein ComEC/Rec2 [Enterococcus asini]MDT2757055.1 DNA internalization-related competence protein ComEC/Rec2 [Enterococcus asini]
MRQNDWQNQLIFPSLLVSFLLLAFATDVWWLWLVVIYFLIVLCCKKQWRLVAVAVFCGFFCLLRWQEWPDKPTNTEERQVELIFTVLRDTIEINGDRVYFDGKTNSGKVAVTTYIEREDLSLWQGLRSKTGKITGKGVFSTGQPQRNLKGFSYADYLWTNGYEGNFQLQKIYQWQMISGKFSVREIRGWLIHHVETTFPAKTALYLKALLFGYKDAAFHELAIDFKKTGILHLFSISGMHLWFFFGLLDKGLRRLRLTKVESFFPMTLALFSGVILFGASASVLRASLAFFVNRVLSLTNQKLSAMDRFALILLVLQFFWPTFLLTASGQLSLYLAWLLIYLTSGSFKNALWLTVLPAPLLMYLFSEWSWIGGLLTILCIPLFSWGLLPGALFLLAGSLLVSFSQSLLQKIEAFSNVFGQLFGQGTWFSIITGQPPWWIVVGCLLISLFLYEKKSKWVVLVTIVVPLVTASLPLKEQISFVDVGQGDSIVLQSRGNREVTVIDTGGKVNFKEKWAQGTSRANSEYTLIPFLKAQGVRRISRLILTHGDADHMGDAFTLFREFPVDELIVTPGCLTEEKQRGFLQRIPKSTKVREVLAGTRLEGAFSLQVLAPNTPGKGENKDSLVIYSEMSGKRFLFMGDLEQVGEKALLKRYPTLKADVLKIGHHGSRSSTAPEFIEKLQVKEAIISCGEKNRFGHPHEEVLQTLADENVQIYRTDLQGMIYYSAGDNQASWVRQDWQKATVNGRIVR